MCRSLISDDILSLFPRPLTCQQPGLSSNSPSCLIASQRSKPYSTGHDATSCSVRSHALLACGGQHGEIRICNLPTPVHLDTPHLWSSSTPVVKPFSIDLTLPTRSINNSITLLPSFPDDWSRQANERRLGFIGARTRRPVEAKRASCPRPPSPSLSEFLNLDSDPHPFEDDDVDMDIARSPTSPVSSGSASFYARPFDPLADAAGPSHRAASLGSLDRPGWGHISSSLSFSGSPPSDLSFSSFLEQPGRRPITVVSSRPSSSHRSFSIHSSTSSQHSYRPPRSPPRNPTNHLNPPKPRPRPNTADQAPRIVISNNDHSVKLFSLTPVTPGSRSGSVMGASLVEQEAADMMAEANARHAEYLAERPLRNIDRSQISQMQDYQRWYNLLNRYRDPVPAPQTRFGGFGWDSIGMNEGIATPPPRAIGEVGEDPYAINQSMRASLLRHEARIRARQIEVLDPAQSRRQEASQSPVNLPSPFVQPANLSSHDAKSHRLERRMEKIGGHRFRHAINHGESIAG